MCLSDSNWAVMFLSFASVYMPGDHPNLMKYTDDVDGLFEDLPKKTITPMCHFINIFPKSSSLPCVTDGFFNFFHKVHHFHV